MANVANGEIYRMSVYCRMTSTTAVNVFHLRINAAGAGTLSDQVMADNLSDLWAPQLKELIANDATYFGLQIRQVWPVSETPKQAQSREATGVGTGGEQALPPQVCGLIKLMTGFAGRKNRGRTYVPFPSEAFNTTEGGPTVGYATALTTYGNFLKGNFDLDAGADGWVGNLVIFNKTRDPVFVNINSYAIRTRFGTQRRRSYLSGGDDIPF